MNRLVQREAALNARSRGRTVWVPTLRAGAFARSAHPHPGHGRRRRFTMSSSIRGIARLPFAMSQQRDSSAVSASSSSSLAVVAVAVCADVYRTWADSLSSPTLGTLGRDLNERHDHEYAVARTEIGTCLPMTLLLAREELNVDDLTGRG
jgi:hypothetical protein